MGPTVITLFSFSYHGDLFCNGKASGGIGLDVGRQCAGYMWDY